MYWLLLFKGYTSQQEVPRSSQAGFYYVSSHPLNLPFSHSRNVWDMRHTERHNFSDCCMIPVLGFFLLYFREGTATLHSVVMNNDFTHENEYKLICFNFSSLFLIRYFSIWQRKNWYWKTWQWNKFYPLKLKKESSLWVLCMVKALYLLSQGLSLNWWF